MKRNVQLNSKPADFNSLPLPAGDYNLSAYLKKISKYPMLSQNEEKELAKRAQSGDSDAKKALVQSNLRLVVSIAKKSIHVTSLTMLDLIQEGNMGLIAAIDKFNWRLGYKFSTYAAWWVKQAMFKAISEQTYSMKIPVYIQETLSKYKKVKMNLERKYNCCVSNSQVAQEMGLSAQKIDVFLNAYSKALSLEQGYELNGTKEMSLGEIIEDVKQNVEAQIESKELRKDLYRALESLKDREKEVIALRFGLENKAKKTLEEIGNLYGVTKECIRQIEKRALSKMHSSNHSLNLACYIM